MLNSCYIVKNAHVVHMFEPGQCPSVIHPTSLSKAMSGPSKNCGCLLSSLPCVTDAEEMNFYSWQIKSYWHMPANWKNHIS